MPMRAQTMRRQCRRRWPPLAQQSGNRRPRRASRATAEVDAAFVEPNAWRDALRRFDKGGDAFYDQISALHKSVRGSSPDARAVLDRAHARRRRRSALSGAAHGAHGHAKTSAWPIRARCAWRWTRAETYERLGSPEGELALAEAVIYLACAAKSNAVYIAYNAARAFIGQTSRGQVPEHLRNAPTKLMKELGYGKSIAMRMTSRTPTPRASTIFPMAWPT